MKIALEIINNAYKQHKTAGIAFSGGSDSMVLLDLIYRHTTHRPPLIWVDSGMEYPETESFVLRTAATYNARLVIAKPKRTPLEQWHRQGWPMLGKLAARYWNRAHKDFGFKCDVSSYCRNMKIAPGRRKFRDLGLAMQFTGQRGQVDDALRGLRAIKDGATKYLKQDKLTVCNPLLGWTDMMIRRYRRRHELPEHPAKIRGAVTIGCVYCGGGAQFTNSGFRVLRHTWPEAWRRLIVDWRAGEAILAIKYDVPLDVIKAAIDRAGGLEHLANSRPWIFDFLRKTPMKGYEK